LSAINGIADGQSPPFSLCRQSAFGSFSFSFASKKKENEHAKIFNIFRKCLTYCTFCDKLIMNIVTKVINNIILAIYNKNIVQKGINA